MTEEAIEEAGRSWVVDWPEVVVGRNVVGCLWEEEQIAVALYEWVNGGVADELADGRTNLASPASAEGLKGRSLAGRTVGVTGPQSTAPSSHYHSTMQLAVAGTARSGGAEHHRPPNSGLSTPDTPPMSTHLNMNPSMDVALPWPGYLIYRPVGLDAQPDLTAPPVFFPAKDSDELFDALRVKYPLVKSHSERMRDAIIEFLIDERQAEQNQQADLFLATTSTETMPADPTRLSPWQQSWPSMSSDASSSWSSPETHGLATPTSADSPRCARGSRAGTAPNTNASSTGATPAALERMTGVFSLSQTAQPKQRVRRKMTESEKVEYRARRIVKACENASSGFAEIRRAPSVHPQQPLDFDFDMFCVDDSLTTDEAFFDSLYPLSEDMIPNAQHHQKRPFDSTYGVPSDIYGFDSLQDRQWSSDQHNWTLADQCDGHSDGTWPVSCGMVMPNDTIQSQQTLTFTPALDAGNWSGNSGPSSQASSPLSQQIPELNMVLNTDERARVSIDAVPRHHPQTGNVGALEAVGRQEPRVETPQPTHTLHAHTMNSQSLRAATSQALEDIRPSGPMTFPQVVLTLISTARAIRAFGRHVGSSSMQNVSVIKAMGALTTSDSCQDMTKSQTSDPVGTHGTRDGLDVRHKSYGPPPLASARATAQKGRPAVQRPLAESMDRVASPSVELYMLKQRVLNGARLHARSQTFQPLADNNATTTEESGAGECAHMRHSTSGDVQAPVHRLKQYARANATDAVRATPNAMHGASVAPNANTGATFARANATVSRSVSSSQMLENHDGTEVAHAERLSCHNTYRDHHGRSSAVASDLESIRTVLFFTVFSAAVLAVCGVVRMALPFLALVALAQCMTKASPWLTRLQDVSSQTSRALRRTRQRRSQEYRPCASSNLEMASSRLQIVS
nr:hypothetical protein CFP56_41268 [Quercus suber]